MLSAGGALAEGVLAGAAGASSSFTVLALTCTPGFTFCSPSTMTFFTRLQPRSDDPEIADPFAGFDHTLLHGIVRFNDHDVVEPLNLLHRELGNQQGIFLEIGYEPGFASALGPGVQWTGDWES